MRKPLIAGNWKMNLLASQVDGYMETLSHALKSLSRQKGPGILLAVPAPFLSTARPWQERESISIAAQTIHEKSEGAFTGEISVPMLLDLGIHWTLIGHSERRQYFNESDRSVALKARTACENGVTPIVCVGETQAERQQGLTADVLERQLGAVLSELPEAADWVIAYEPVWAIGTGLTATDAQAQEAHAFIRQCLRKRWSVRADHLRILYGGSVKSSNVAGLMGQPDIDGALVGGASLDPREFARIVLAVS